MVDTARRDQIRSRVIEKKLITNQLREEFSDAYLKQHLQMIWRWFDDIERFFLDNVDRQRTEAAEARWLDHAEFFLNLHTTALKEMQKVMDTYGKTATTVGG